MPLVPTTVQTHPQPILHEIPQKNVGPEGLGGWLILVGIGLIITPIRIAAAEFTILGVILDGTWSRISDSTSEYYNWLLAVMIPLEFIMNLAFIFGFIFLIYLYFTKSSNFPRWFIAIYAANLIFILADAFLVNLAVPGQPVFDADTSKELFRSFAACVVWIPFMLKSKRVEATFVN